MTAGTYVMRATKKYLLVLGMAIFAQISYAQQDMQFTHFMFSRLYYNPGYAAVDELPKATLLHRSQWAGYKTWDGSKGAPTTQLLTTTLPLTYVSPDLTDQGVGLNLAHDKLGAHRNVSFNLSYARAIHLNSLGVNNKVSIGAKLGFWSQSVDESVLKYGDQDDVTIDQLVNNGASQVKPDMSLGAFYESDKGHYAGIALNHAGRPNFDYKADAKSKLYRHMHVMGGYLIEISPELMIKPKALLSTDFKKLTYNLSGLATYYMDEIDVWGGLNFRQSFAAKHGQDDATALNNDAISILAGLAFLTDKESGFKALRFGYALDIITTGVSAKRGTSHEIVLSYLLPLKAPTGNNTPRYIHDN